MNSIPGFVLVAVGGALGALARYGLGLAIYALRLGPFPWATFFINVLGSFALGFVTALIVQRSVASPEALRLGIGVGFLGAFTTFSTYELESSILASQGRWGLALANLVGSVVAGFLAVRLGTALGR